MDEITILQWILCIGTWIITFMIVLLGVLIGIDEMRGDNTK